MVTTRQIAEELDIATRYVLDWRVYLPKELQPKRGAGHNRCGYVWKNKSIDYLRVVKQLFDEQLHWKEIKSRMKELHDKGAI